jgi:hypothetical protein
LVAALAAVALALLLFVAWLDPTCDEGDAEVAFARSLSDARLAKLFLDVRFYAPWRHMSQDEIPEEFLDLEPLAIRAHQPGSVHFRLRGCMDHHIDLVVYGADAPDRDSNPRIELWYDEWPPQHEVLWTSTATSTSR